MAVGPSRRSVARAPFQSQQAIGPQKKKTKEKKLCRVVVVVVVDRSRSPPIAISLSLSSARVAHSDCFTLFETILDIDKIYNYCFSGYPNNFYSLLLLILLSLLFLSHSLYLLFLPYLLCVRAIVYCESEAKSSLRCRRRRRRLQQAPSE